MAAGVSSRLALQPCHCHRCHLFSQLAAHVVLLPSMTRCGRWAARSERSNSDTLRQGKEGQGRVHTAERYVEGIVEGKRRG